MHRSYQNIVTGLCLGLIFAALINNLGMGLLFGLLTGFIIDKGFFGKRN